MSPPSGPSQSRYTHISSQLTRIGLNAMQPALMDSHYPSLQASSAIFDYIRFKQADKEEEEEEEEAEKDYEEDFKHLIALIAIFLSSRLKCNHHPNTDTISCILRDAMIASDGKSPSDSLTYTDLLDDEDAPPFPPPFVGSHRVISVPPGMRNEGSSMLGGAILGWGRNNTVVYTLDEVPRFNPDIQSACLEDSSGNCVPLSRFIYTSGQSSQKKNNKIFLNPSMIVVKHVFNMIDSIRESKRNLIVRKLFEKNHKLIELTLFDPVFVTLKLSILPAVFPSPLRYSLDSTDHETSSTESSKTRSRKNKKKLKAASKYQYSARGNFASRSLLPIHKSHLIYRRMEGSLGNTTDVITNLKDFHSLAAVCIQFLHHLHQNGYLHIDIKPANIGFYKDKTDHLKFAVGDYGLVATMNHVMIRLRKTGTYQAGTRGYISPLFIPSKHDAGTRRTFSKFATVASYCRLPPKQNHTDFAYWERYFNLHRRKCLMDPKNLAKADLHSLALTLYDLVPEDLRKEWLSDSKGIVPRLMFFRKGDFITARDALNSMNSNKKPIKNQSIR